MDNFKKILSLLALVLCAGITACDVSEFEDDCTVDTQLTFRFSRYGTDLIGAEVPSLSVFVFDEADKFVGRWDEMDRQRITAQYTMTLPLPPGTYRYVVWGGLVDQNYYLSLPWQGHGNVMAPVVGETSLSEFAVRVRRTTRDHHYGPLNFVDHVPGALFFGSTQPITLEANVDQNVEITLVKYTNTINLTVIGLPPRTRAYSHIDINLHSANGSYDFDGELTPDCQQLTYPQHDAANGGSMTWTTTIHTMRPVFGNDHLLSFYNTQTDAEYYSIDLLDDAIRKVQDGSGSYVYNTQEAVDAEDTFDIELDLRPEAAVAVRVNGWTVNSFEGDIQ